MSLLFLLHFSAPAFLVYTVQGRFIVVAVLAKSQKYATKEVKRKGAEPEVSDALVPAHDARDVAAEAVRGGTGAGGDRHDARKKDEESLKYATKSFSGTGFLQSQSKGRLYLLTHCFKYSIKGC